MSSGPAAPPGRVLLDRDALRAAVARVARGIEADFPAGVVLVAVLKGALLFCADLAREIRGIAVEVDFLAISRYAPDSGRVRIVHDVSLDLTGRDVVIVEDLVDTGLTAAFLLRYLEGLGARRVELCTLLDKPARRILPVQPRYVGAEVPDVFVLGAGLHLFDRYRNLPVVMEVDRSEVAARLRHLGLAAGRPEAGEDPGGTLEIESEATA